MISLLVSVVIHSCLPIGSNSNVSGDRQSIMPAVLVIQEFDSGKPDTKNFVSDDGGANILKDIDSTDAITQEFKSQEKVIPIRWSLDDPIFSSLIESHKARLYKGNVPLNDAISTAKLLRCQYILTSSVQEQSGELLCHAELYKDGILVWNDPAPEAQSHKYVDADLSKLNLTPQQKKEIMDHRQAAEKLENKLDVLKKYRMLSIKLGSKNSDIDAVNSIARTWVSSISSTVFKKIAVVPIISDPGPSPSEISNLASNVTIPPNPDETELKTSLVEVEKDNSPGETIALLEDAVDAAPFDMNRRTMLIQALEDNGHYDLAASEALSGTKLRPKDVSMRLRAATILLATGSFDGAENQAEIAQTISPNNPEAQLILGKVFLSKNNIQGALKNFEDAFKNSPTTEIANYYKISLALAGKGEDVITSIVPKEDSNSVRFDYKIFSECTYESLIQQATELRDLFTTVLNPEETKDYSIAIRNISKRSRDCAFVLSTFNLDTESGKVNDQRVLALNLLTQSAEGLIQYKVDHKGETLDDARIALGQAIQYLKTSQILDVDST